jgi:DNA-binding MarR family transcriptional regulator
MRIWSGGNKLPERSLARALGRKIGLPQDILKDIRTIEVERSLLMNTSRRRIFSYICQHPCSHLRAISRGMDQSPQNVKWHVIQLRYGGFVSEYAIGNRTCFGPLDFISQKECRVLSLLNERHARAIFLLIRKQPGIGQMEICGNLKIYQQKLSRIMAALESRDLVSWNIAGRSRKYFTTGKMDLMMESYDGKEGQFEERLMVQFEKDGLNPVKHRSRRHFLVVQVDVGTKSKKKLAIPLNPARQALAGRLGR